MDKVHDLERAVQSLSDEELVAFRRWFAEFDAATWDRQFDSDVHSGKLDRLGDQARRAHAAGKSSKL